MSPGAWMSAVMIAITAGALGWILFSMVRSIQNERRRGQPILKNFGLSISLMVLFFATWVGHGVAQWQTFTDQQTEHNQPVEVGNFVTEFAQSTLENWQSEFLQLFSFVVLAALFIHKGSAESKDSDEEMLTILKRIDNKMS